MLLYNKGGDNMQEIIEIINGVGFPIFTAIAMFYLLQKQGTQIAELKTAIIELTAVVAKLTDKVG